MCIHYTVSNIVTVKTYRQTFKFQLFAAYNTAKLRVADSLHYCSELLQSKSYLHR